MIRVVEPGAFTTVQDFGRPGLAAIGVPPSGAFDDVAFRAANLLAGNSAGSAALEITVAGPLLTFDAEAVVAIAGARCDAQLDGMPVPHAESFGVPSGASLRLGRAREGLRTYLAVRGGISVPEVLGGSSTLVSAGFGGWLGRPLAANDYLRGGEPVTAPMRRLAKAPVEHDGIVRAVPGPQTEGFTEHGRKAFFEQPFTVSPRSDRVGVRLEGEPLELAGSADLDPEGVVTGAVQVPGDGMPIVLGPDRPVTGGYVKIATVITADLPKIAQARPGDTLRFVSITPDKARAVLLEQEATLAQAIEDVG
jgi:antagonist of KipI